jgi:FtsH-binding integral membrane protein
MKVVENRMDYAQSSLQGVYRQSVETRARFIMRTYLHLFGAVLAFAAIEVALFSSGAAYSIAAALSGTSWLLVLGAFMVVGWLATRFAHGDGSLLTQYLGLGLYVAAQSVIFVPLLFVAQSVAPGAIQSAATVTLLGFGGLTAVVFVTRRDFSFLGSLIKWGGVMALVTIIAGALFGFELGTFFSVAMIGLAGASVLWDTSNVLHHFPPNRYVGAALQLFASLAVMFWYVLRLFVGSRSE